jgi:anti-anti-sigma factor
MTLSELQEFGIREESGPERIVWLTLYGELDLTTVGELDQRVWQLMVGGVGVRVDLSQLRFIDACGLRAVVQAVETANDRGGTLEIDPCVSRPVGRLIGLVGAEAQIWPGIDCSEGEGNALDRANRRHDARLRSRLQRPAREVVVRRSRDRPHLCRDD